MSRKPHSLKGEEDMKRQLVEGTPSSKPQPQFDVSLDGQQCDKHTIDPSTTTRPREIIEESRLN